MEENRNEIIETEITNIQKDFGVEHSFYSQSKDVSDIDKGMLEFHKQLDSISKSGKNDHFKYTYATLDKILENVNSKLAEQNLYITQVPINVGEDRLAIRTSIRSINGQFMTMDSVSFKYKTDIQLLGSYMTYLKRYSLSAILAISFSEDTDCTEEKVKETTSTPAAPITERTSARSGRRSAR